jgi:hypothetical protein
MPRVRGFGVVRRRKPRTAESFRRLWHAATRVAIRLCARVRRKPVLTSGRTFTSSSFVERDNIANVTYSGGSPTFSSRFDVVSNGARPKRAELSPHGSQWQQA